jgi:hypothetical protein
MNLNLEFSFNTDCPDILIEVFVDNQKIFESPAQQQLQQVLYTLSESPAVHELKLVMSGKNRSHTKVDKNGEIISDVFLNIEQLEFENVDIKEVFCLGKKCYTHSFNSTQPEFLDEFYGTMGCNGTVNIEFSTPIYLWLADYL